MKPEAQRIAIAEVCPEATKGTIYIPAGDGFQMIEFERDPLNDLNAMHSAEKMLSRGQQCVDYQQTIACIETRDQGHSGFMGLGCHATAAQRAEAFLRAIGKWEE